MATGQKGSRQKVYYWYRVVLAIQERHHLYRDHSIILATLLKTVNLTEQ
jgi:hypothetical protein